MLKIASTISFFFCSGWHIKKVRLIQGLKMCLLRHVFPKGTAFRWQNVCILPLHCLFETRKDKKVKDSKSRVEGLPGKFPETTTKQSSFETDRPCRELWFLWRLWVRRGELWSFSPLFPWCSSSSWNYQHASRCCLHTDAWRCRCVYEKWGKCSFQKGWS